MTPFIGLKMVNLRFCRVFDETDENSYDNYGCWLIQLENSKIIVKILDPTWWSFASKNVFCLAKEASNWRWSWSILMMIDWMQIVFHSVKSAQLFVIFNFFVLLSPILIGHKSTESEQIFENCFWLPIKILGAACFKHKRSSNVIVKPSNPNSV